MQRHICVQSLNSQCLVWSEVKWSSPSHVWLFLTPWTYTAHGILQARILECSSDLILQGIIPTQESNPGLPHCRQILYPLSHKGSHIISIESRNCLVQLAWRKQRGESHMSTNQCKWSSSLHLLWVLLAKDWITPTEATEGPYLDRFPEIAIAWSNHMILCLAVNTMLFFWMWKPPEKSRF